MESIEKNINNDLQLEICSSNYFGYLFGNVADAVAELRIVGNH
jgi:hypothetical protein